MPRHGHLLRQVTAAEATLNRRGFLKQAGAAAGVIAAPGVWPSSAHAQPKTARGAARPAAKLRAQRLAAVRTWGYQLRLLNFQELAASPTDMLVIDHGFSNGQRFIRQFEPWEVEYLKTKPDGSRRLVLAYISIGEAERYRFYWQPAWFEAETKPAWLGEMNPRWAGNYPVDFWMPEWQRIITGGPDSYVSRIAAQGFDGLYLDRADVFQELLPRYPKGAAAMAAFIARLAAEWRAGAPERLIILQNAEELIAQKAVREAIDAIAKEDLYFGLDYTQSANSTDAIKYAEQDLKRAQAAGKRIFTIEYVGEPAAQASVRQRSARNGFLPTFGPRDLSSLVTDPTVLAPDYAGPLVPQEGRWPMSR